MSFELNLPNFDILNSKTVFITPTQHINFIIIHPNPI